MDSLRKWFYKPRRDDQSLLAQFFYADEALNLVAAELDSFDGRKDPDRCSSLVNHLRQCQDKVLNICSRIMDELIPSERADRDFRVKFPDDVMQDNLAGQLWFGAECLAAGSSIMNRETESGAMRPLAKALTKSLENVRNLLREASLRTHAPSELAHDRLIESLKMFDRLLADFELCYVSAMVPVKTVNEYQLQQDVVVLFSETLQRALKLGLLSQETIDQCDPALMFTIPRLAIVTGLLIYPEGPLSLDTTPHHMSEMFRPFRTLLVKIRELLWTLTEAELLTLEKMLCSSEDPVSLSRKPSSNCEADLSEEESSGWGGEGEASECETVMEQLPATIVPTILSSQADDSGIVTLQSTSHSPESMDEPAHQINTEVDDPSTPDEVEKTMDMDIREDEESDEGSSSNSDQAGFINLNGQWTLPIIPCACSVDISEDATMTKQGLLNRSFQQDREFGTDTVENACEECILRQMNDSKTEVPSENLQGVEDSEDVRWACDTDVPSTSEGEQVNGQSECDVRQCGDSSVNSVQSDSNRDIINSDEYVNYKQSVLRTIEEWKHKSLGGESSEDLHVRYAENWEALCSSGQLPKDCDKRQKSGPVTDSLSSSCSSCHTTLTSSVTSDSCSITSETSSFNSDCQDDEEVALALRAVQHAANNWARAKFRSSSDLLHRLFVCISGVADQLQTNFAVNGQPAERGAWPWMAALGYSSPTKPLEWLCGGSLISNRHVLTAAHCLTNIGPRKLFVIRLGDLNLDDSVIDGATPTNYSIDKWIAHENYNRLGRTDDIGLVKLKEHVKYTNLIRPICVPKQNTITGNPTDFAPYIAGWGSTSYGGPQSNALQEAQIEIEDQYTCKEVYKIYNNVTIDDRVICAISPLRKDTCQGDSGGPLMLEENSNYYVIGVVSYGFKCAVPGYPGVYTNVSMNVDWIRKKMHA